MGKRNKQNRLKELDKQETDIFNKELADINKRIAEYSISNYPVDDLQRVYTEVLFSQKRNIIAKLNPHNEKIY